jgi:hypothetical protein
MNHSQLDSILATFNLELAEKIEHSEQKTYRAFKHVDGRKVMVLESTTGTILREDVPVPDGSVLRGFVRQSEKATMFLGCLTEALQPRGLQATLLFDQVGLTTVALSAHLCAAEEQAAVRYSFSMLDRVAVFLRNVIRDAPTDLWSSLRAGFQRSAPMIRQNLTGPNG